MTNRFTPCCGCGCPRIKYPLLSPDREIPSVKCFKHKSTEVETETNVGTRVATYVAGVPTYVYTTDIDTVTSDPVIVETVEQKLLAGTHARHQVGDSVITQSRVFTYDPPDALTQEPPLVDYIETRVDTYTTVRTYDTIRYRLSLLFDVSWIDYFDRLRYDALTRYLDRAVLTNVTTAATGHAHGFDFDADHPDDPDDFDAAYTAADPISPLSPISNVVTSLVPTAATSTMRLLIDSSTTFYQLADVQLLFYPWWRESIAAGAVAYDWRDYFVKSFDDPTWIWQSKKRMKSIDTEFVMRWAVDGETVGDFGVYNYWVDADDYVVELALIDDDDTAALTVTLRVGLTSPPTPPDWLGIDSVTIAAGGYGIVCELQVEGLGISETLNVLFRPESQCNLRVCLFDDTLIITSDINGHGGSIDADVERANSFAAWKPDGSWNTIGNTIVMPRPRLAPDFVDPGRVRLRASTESDFVYITSLEAFATEPHTVINSPRPPYDPDLADTTKRKWCPLPETNCSNVATEESLRLAIAVDWPTTSGFANTINLSAPMFAAQCSATASFAEPSEVVLFETQAWSFVAQISIVDGDYLLTITWTLSYTQFITPLPGAGGSSVTTTSDVVWEIPLGTEMINSFRDIPETTLALSEAENWDEFGPLEDDYNAVGYTSGTVPHELLRYVFWYPLADFVLTLSPQA